MQSADSTRTLFPPAAEAGSLRFRSLSAFSWLIISGLAFEPPDSGAHVLNHVTTLTATYLASRPPATKTLTLCCRNSPKTVLDLVTFTFNFV